VFTIKYIIYPGPTLRNCSSEYDALCCPPNTVALVTNSTSYLNCVCKEGFYGRVYNYTTSTCQPCPPDKFLTQIDPPAPVQFSSWQGLQVGSWLLDVAHLAC
jgi:hypothetical protein